MSVSLIAKYLGAEKQAELARSLSGTLGQNPENVAPLVELLDGLQPDAEITTNVANFLKHIAYNKDHYSDADYTHVAEIAAKLPAASQILLQSITSTLLAYIHANQHNFVPGFLSILEDNIQLQQSQSQDTDVLHLLTFLDHFFMYNTTNNASAIDNILLMFLGNNEEEVAEIVSKLLRWRIDHIRLSTKDSDLVWRLIVALHNTQAKNHQSHSYILWLRYVNNDKLVSNSVFQHVMSQNLYWQMLQLGLISDSHEHRKFCLSILQLSVKSIATSFTNDFISWDTANTNVHLKEWARYATLFEIMGIDTSLHQAEAGSSDIIGLISPTSLIHPSWGFCLLSTGFKASMDSVRKFSLRLLLSIPLQNLYLIKFGLPFLEEVYLPYAMLASNFAVRIVEGKQACEFGTTLTTFVTNMIVNLNTNEEFEAVVYSILKVLENMKESFDPARIYVSLGILKGLLNKQVLSFGKHDQPLIKLFENRAEGDLFEISSQTINLRLLLSFKLELSSFFGVLIKFLKFNGYKIIKNNLPLIRKYMASNNIDDSALYEYVQLGSSLEMKVVAFAMITQDQKWNDFLAQQNALFLARFLETGITLEQPGHVITTTDLTDDEIFAALANVDFANYKQIASDDILDELWTSICNGIQSSDYHDLGVTVQKHRFFNRLLRVSEHAFTLANLEEYESKMLINSDELTKTVKNFYKLKDEVFGEYYTTLEYLSQKTKLQYGDFLPKLTSTSSNYAANFAMVKTISNSIDSAFDKDVVEFLVELWKNLDSTRLQLNQKDLHIAIIEILFSNGFLKRSADFAAEYLEFSKSVIDNSQGRRSLLPALTRQLLTFQRESRESFDQLEWIPEVLVRSAIMFQLRSNIFKLEALVGHVYDENLVEGDLYTEIYGPAEISARVNVMALFNSSTSSTFANRVFRFIFDHAEEFSLLVVLKSTDGFEEWRRIQLMSILVSVCKYTDMGDYIETLIKLFETEPSPLVRAYIEWIVALTLVENREYCSELFAALITNAKPSIVTSYERTLFLMVQQLAPEEETDFLSRLLTVIIPGATSNKATTRHFSLSLITSIHKEIQLKNLDLDSQIVEVVANMNKAAEVSESFGQYRSGDALVWDIERDATLVDISGGLLMRLSDRDDFDFITRNQYLTHLSHEDISSLNKPVGHNNQDLWVRERKFKQSAATASSTQSPLQTKSGAWNIMDVDETRGEVVRSDLIVVSSLVDKPPNLGGICRLSDVLGAGLLTLNDLRAKHNSQFKSVAVTADQWMPMIEVKVEEIKNYLIEKKKDGYTLIGLEQTDKSVELNSELKFPKKSLILLGREKEGVPGDLLAELDFCVEIKQVGVIRSMNIQTATAIIVHAYSTQHC